MDLELPLGSCLFGPRNSLIDLGGMSRIELILDTEYPRSWREERRVLEEGDILLQSVLDAGQPQYVRIPCISLSDGNYSRSAH